MGEESVMRSQENVEDCQDPGEKVKHVLRILRRCYELPTRNRNRSAIDVLVGTILSQNTSGPNSSAGFDRLKKTFPTWSEVADAPVRKIEKCIRVSGLSRIKAPRIRRILRSIRSEHGRVDLEFLGDLSPADALDYLMQFDGVGPKTALCVLLFAFGKNVFPVDTHIHRIAKRLGLLDSNVSVEKGREILTRLIPPRSRYAMHVLLIRHGQRTCRDRNPLCPQCPLLDLCPDGQQRTPTKQ